MSKTKLIEFVWKKGKTNKERLIFSNEKEIGYLKRSGFFRDSAIGEINKKKYDFSANGFINVKFKIRDMIAGKMISQFEHKWIGNNTGILNFESGQEYTWKCIDFLRGRWAWIDSSENEIMQFYPDDLFHRSGKIVVNTEFGKNDDFDLLIQLGLHLRLFYNFCLILLIIILFAMIMR